MYDILDYIVEPICIIDFEGNFIYKNQEFENFKILNGVKIVNKLIESIISLKYIKEGLAVKNYYQDIEDNIYLIDVYPYKNYFIVIIRDITRLTKLEEESKKEGSLITISKLLSEIFHDMKGPITGIKAAAEYIKSNPEEIDLLDDILDEVKRLENFLHQLSYLTKPINLNLNFENIHKLIDEVIKKYRSLYRNVRFIRMYDPSLPDIKLDRNMILSVLENLIENSIESAGENATIKIETSISFDSTYSPKGDKISIKITDSGPGVPKDIIDKLFLPFYTTKEFGTGVGLAKSYKIVKSHKGVLRYLGNSTFEIILPINEER